MTLNNPDMLGTLGRILMMMMHKSRWGREGVLQQGINGCVNFYSGNKMRVWKFYAEKKQYPIDFFT